MKNKTQNTACLIAALLVTTAVSAPASALSFREALKAAYENNPDLNAERSNLKVTDERVNQAFSGFLPDASFSEARYRIKNDLNTRQNAQYGTVRTLSITEPIFNGGSTWQRLNSARSQVMAAREGLLNSEQQTLLNAIIAYNNVLRDTAVVELSKSNREVLRKRMDMSTERFKVGELTKTDVAQSESRLSSSVATLAQAEADLAASKASFVRITGLKPEGLEQDVPLLGTEPEDVDMALKTAMGYNPNIRSAVYQQKSAKSDVYAAAGDLLPSVRLVASKSTNDNVSPFIRGAEDEKRVGVVLNVPIYQNGGINYSRLRAARGIAESRKYDVTASRDEATGAVIEAWERLRAARSAIESNKQAVKATELAVEGTQMEADLGTRTTLEVLDTQQELFLTKVNLVRSERDARVAYYTLLANMGQLTANRLDLGAKIYNPRKNYNKVKYQPIGW